MDLPPISADSVAGIPVLTEQCMPHCYRRLGSLTMDDLTHNSGEIIFSRENLLNSCEILGNSRKSLLSAGNSPRRRPGQCAAEIADGLLDSRGLAGLTMC
ncbi:hypothetical protein MOSE0_B04742 [Monosporozyma servazzii]